VVCFCIEKCLSRSVTRMQPADTNFIGRTGEQEEFVPMRTVLSIIILSFGSTLFTLRLRTFLFISTR